MPDVQERWAVRVGEMMEYLYAIAIRILWAFPLTFSSERTNNIYWYLWVWFGGSIAPADALVIGE